MPKTDQKIPGYHFEQSVEGAFALEVDVPCEGVTTITWRPQEYPGKPASMEIPTVLVLPATESYVRELTAKPTR